MSNFGNFIDESDIALSYGVTKIGRNKRVLCDVLCLGENVVSGVGDTPAQALTDAFRKLRSSNREACPETPEGLSPMNLWLIEGHIAGLLSEGEPHPYGRQ